MLTVGDRIEATDGKITGELVHLEDGIAYVELDNGVEMEFDEMSLQPEGTWAAADQAARDEKQNLSSGRTETDEVYDETFAALPEKIRQMGEQIFNRICQDLTALSKDPTDTNGWHNVNSYQKLNNISVMLNTRTEKLVSMYKNKESFAMLEIVMLAAIGSAMGAM